MENPILTQEDVTQIRRILNLEPLYLNDFGEPHWGTDIFIKLTFKRWGIEPDQIQYFFGSPPSYNTPSNQIHIIYTMDYDRTDHTMLINNIIVR
jgi:hypothetical protein